MARALLRLPQVLERVPYKRSRLYGLIREGRFPAPLNVGPRIVAWDSDAIDSWINTQIADATGKRVVAAQSPKTAERGPCSLEAEASA